MYILLYLCIGCLLCVLQAYIGGFSKSNDQDVLFTLLVLLLWPFMIAYYVFCGLGSVLERISKLK